MEQVAMIYLCANIIRNEENDCQDSEIGSDEDEAIQFGVF